MDKKPQEQAPLVGDGCIFRRAGPFVIFLMSNKIVFWKNLWSQRMYR